MASYITQPLAYGGDLLRNALGNVTWGPALSISKATVASLFSRIETGTLIIDDRTSGDRKATYSRRIDKGSSKHTNGVNGHSKKGGKVRAVEVVVHKEAFWVRLFLFADMGFAESYMLGEFECSDLTKFFEVCFKIFQSNLRCLTK